MNLSRKTVLELGHALETSAAIHVLDHDPKKGLNKYLPKSHYDDGFVNTGHKACGDALKRLRRALHLPKNFSFTTARMAAYDHESAQWHRKMRRRAARKSENRKRIQKKEQR